MSFTECPYCHRIAKDRGSVISKEIGSPLVTCKNCNRLVTDNNMYEWGVIPIESKISFYLLCNYRFAFLWLASLLPLSIMINDSFLLGLFLMIVFEAITCQALYFYVIENNSHKIKESINRSNDMDYIGQLIELNYDKLDLKIYEKYIDYRKQPKNVCIEHQNQIQTQHYPEPTTETVFSQPVKEEQVITKVPNSSVQHQNALDKWKNRKKNDWDIGIEYERYIGYLLECEGYRVSYVGATQGLNDRGRDLIATKKKNGLVIQCKRWSKDKTIHEKHIHQLHGSTAVLSIQNPEITYRAVFITTTELSPEAKKDAALCNIEVIEQFPMSEYPLIKCNSNMRGQKIYHLPFDPQYDLIIISKNKESCYAWTIEEAESMGFRHSQQKKIKEVHAPKYQINNDQKQPYQVQKTIYSPDIVKSMASQTHGESNSSLIEKTEYSDNLLFLTFSTGHTYCYCNVPETVYKEMIVSPSKGRFFHDRIKGKYPYC